MSHTISIQKNSVYSEIYDIVININNYIKLSSYKIKQSIIVEVDIKLINNAYIHIIHISNYTNNDWNNSFTIRKQINNMNKSIFYKYRNRNVKYLSYYYSFIIKTYNIFFCLYLTEKMHSKSYFFSTILQPIKCINNIKKINSMSYYKAVKYII